MGYQLHVYGNYRPDRVEQPDMYSAGDLQHASESGEAFRTCLTNAIGERSFNQLIGRAPDLGVDDPDSIAGFDGWLLASEASVVLGHLGDYLADSRDVLDSDCRAWLHHLKKALVSVVAAGEGCAVNYN